MQSYDSDTWDMSNPLLSLVFHFDHLCDHDLFASLLEVQFRPVVRLAIQLQHRETE